MKLPFTAVCDLDGSATPDEFVVEDGGTEVVVYAYRNGGIVSSLYIAPAKARRLAKAIKKAARKVEDEVAQ